MADQNSTTPPEVFKPVPDFPAYDIGNRGTVRSYWKRQGRQWIAGTTPNKILKARLAGDYLAVTLLKEGRRHFRTVHTLVLLAFVGEPPPGLESRHLDGIPANCFLENLCYGTHGENMLDRKTHGIHRPLCSRGTAHPMAKLTDEQVLRIRELASQGCYSITAIGKMFGVSRNAIGDIVHRRKWTHLP